MEIIKTDLKILMMELKELNYTKPMFLVKRVLTHIIRQEDIIQKLVNENKKLGEILNESK